MEKLAVAPPGTLSTFWVVVPSCFPELSSRVTLTYISCCCVSPFLILPSTSKVLAEIIFTLGAPTKVISLMSADAVDGTITVATVGIAGVGDTTWVGVSTTVAEDVVETGVGVGELADEVEPQPTSMSRPVRPTRKRRNKFRLDTERTMNGDLLSLFVFVS